MKKTANILLFFMILSAVICILGCSSSSAKGRVYWLNFKPESDEVLHEVAGLYKEKTGIDVKIVAAGAVKG